MEQASGAGWGADRIARILQGPAEWPLLHVAPSARRCSDCGAALRCLKSSTRSLTTLAKGTVRVRELHCPDCGSAPLASRQLACLAPPGQRFGYDLIVWIGLQRNLHMRQRCEMRADLARSGITLSAGSLSALSDRFLHLLGQPHTQRAPALRAAMQHGYPLHLDATSDKGKGGLSLCIDGWRGWVLHAVRIRSENEAELRPALEVTVTLFGHPVAYMRDLGKAGANAVAACCQAPSVDLVCQFHVLAAIGRKLLQGDHAALQHGLTRFKVRSSLREWLRPLRAHLDQASERDRQLPALLLWLLEGDGRKRACFPFGLAHLDFYQRCCRFEQVALGWLQDRAGLAALAAAALKDQERGPRGNALRDSARQVDKELQGPDSGAHPSQGSRNDAGTDRSDQSGHPRAGPVLSQGPSAQTLPPA